MPEQEGATRNFPQLFSAAIGLIGALASVTAVILVILPKSLELTATIVRADNLTELPGISQLEGTFTFKGMDVDDLVSVQLSIENTGDKTIIGRGSAKNILDQDIGFNFPPFVRILDYVQSESSFNYRVTTPNVHSLSIAFDQWREGESINLMVYMEGVERDGRSITVEPRGRELIDGTIVAEVAPASDADQLSFAARYLGRTAAEVLYGLSVATMICLISILLIFAPMPLIETYTSKKWLSRNWEKFESFLDSDLSFLTNNEKRKLQENPSALPKVLWQRFDGKEPPAEPVAKNMLVAIAWTILLFVCVIAMVNALTLV